MFFVGLAVFVVASALCGLAPSVEVLVAARVLQAAGAALLVPTSLGLLLPEFPPERRASATALWGAVGGVAAATGPSLGGLLIEWADWRLVFFVNLALGARGAGCRRGGCCARRATRIAARCPDALGIALLAGGVGALSLAIVEAPDWGWGERAGARRASRSPRSSLAALRVALGRAPASRARALAVPRALVRGGVRGRRACSRSGFYAVLLANILFLTSVWGYSTLEAGLRGHAGAADGGAVERAGGAGDRPLRARVSAVPGGLLFALGCVLFATGLGPSPAYLTEFLPATMLTGIGVGLSFAGWSSAAVAGLPPARFATGSAISACFRQLGAVLGISVLIAVVGASAALADFHRAYALMAVTGSDRGADRADPGARSRYRPGMDLEERTLDDTIARTCAVCGAELTTQEIKEGREAGGPFLCTVHAMEEAPADEIAREATRRRARCSRARGAKGAASSAKARPGGRPAQFDGGVGR